MTYAKIVLYLGLKRDAINLTCDCNHVSRFLHVQLKLKNVDYVLYREYVGTKLAQSSRSGVAISSETNSGCIFWNAETGIYTTQVIQ
jgi:hypothetical protein